MKDPNEALKKADEALRKIVEEKNRQKMEAEKQAIMESVGRELPGMVAPLLHQVAAASRLNTDEVISAIKGVTINPPPVTVTTPEANVTVSHEMPPMPEIPPIDTSGIESAIEKGIAKAKFPAPQVTVQPAKIPDFPKFPTIPEFPSEVSIKNVDKKNPFPVIMMGLDGKPMPFSSGGGAGGGRADFFTIKDIQTSSGSSVIDQDTGAMKVTGNFTVTSSATSTLAQLVDSDGNGYSSANPLQIAGSISTTPGATFYASDAVGSVNVIQSITLETRQVSGAIDSVIVNEIFGSTGTNVINPDGRLKVELPTGSSGLTDTELRASSVPISQVSGASFSTNIVGVTDIFSTTSTSSVVNPDNRVRVELPAGSSGLTDTELRASSVPISQVSGVAFSVSVTDIFGSVSSNVVNPDGRLKVELPTGSSGLTDTELRASHLDVQQLSGTTDSVNVVSTVGLTDTQIRATSLPISQVSGASFSVDVLSIPSVTVTSITNSVQSALIDSSGVQYSGSNPVPVSNIGLAVDNGDAATAQRVVIAGNSSASVSASQAGTWTISVTDVFGSVGTNVINPDGRLKVELPTGSSGLTDTELRASHLDVQQLSGAIDSVYITGASGTIATNLVDSSGVAYSGSNPVPVTFSAAGFQNVTMYDAFQSTISSHQDPTGDFRGLDNSNIRTVNYESVLNSSTTTLGISGVFTGLAEDIKDYSVIALSVFADQNSATDGLSIQQSSNGTNWDIVKTFTITASQGKLISVQAAARYFRIVYTNGGVAQGAFRMMPLFKQGNQKSSSQRTSDAATNEEDLEQVWSYNSGFNGSTWDRIGVNVGSATTAQRVVHASDAVSSVNLVTLNGTAPATGLNETNAGVFRVVQMTDSISSNNVSQWGGSAVATGLNENSAGVVKVAMITSVVGSTNIVTFNGNAPATGLNETTTGVLRTVQMSDTISSVFVTGAFDSMMTYEARTTNPTAKSDGADVRPKTDKLGRALARPVQVRDLIKTAYASTSTQAEVTLATPAASTFWDLIYLMAANNSATAAQIDIRQGTGGTVIMSVNVPANGTAGVSLPVPMPGTEAAQPWTIKNSASSDVSNWTVNVSALFSQEI